MLNLTSQITESFAPENRHAIVTVVIGEEYNDLWNNTCRPSWEKYADKYNCDIIVVNDFLDKSEHSLARSPAWQKLLILDQPWARYYERIIWIDADIIISSTALNIFYFSPDPKLIGIVSSGAQLSDADKQVYFERIYHAPVHPGFEKQAWQTHEKSNFSRCDIADSEDLKMFNTGVMVLNPKHHDQLFREIYKEEEKGRLYEQPFLSRSLCKEHNYHELSPRFNWSIHEAWVLSTHHAPKRPISSDVIMDFINNELEKSYFLHFAGSIRILKLYGQFAPQSENLLKAG